MLENIPAPPHPQAGGRHFRLRFRVEGGELREQFRRFPRPESPVQGPGQFPAHKLHPVPRAFSRPALLSSQFPHPFRLDSAAGIRTGAGRPADRSPQVPAEQMLCGCRV